MPTSFRTLGLALLGWALLFVMVCDDGPTKPKPVQKSYPFYFNDRINETFVYRYDPVADSLDTLVLPVPAYGRLAVSHDGRLLYIGFTTSTSVIDLTSLSLHATLPYPADRGIAVSPDGGLVALAGKTLTVLRTADYGVVFSDSSDYAFPSFSKDGKTLTCAKIYNQMLILQFGPESVTSRTRTFLANIVSTAVRPDGKQFAVYSVWGNRDWFGAYVQLYDAAGDSLLFTTPVYPGWGDLVYAPDGQILVYSNPGEQYHSFPSDTLYFLQTEPPYAAEKFITSPVVDQNDSLHNYMPVWRMAITPDGRYLAGATRRSQGQAVIYRLPSRELQACYNFDFPLAGHGSIVSNVACQSGR